VDPFMMVTPVATAEPVGPIGALRRSWALTRGHYWRLLGTFLLLLLVATVAILALSSTLGIVLVLLAGPPEPGNLTWMVTALVSVLFQTLMTVVLGCWRRACTGSWQGRTPPPSLPDPSQLQVATGGRLIRIASILPPVLSPNRVPRS
jgi:hypothetical protein